MWRSIVPKFCCKKGDFALCYAAAKKVRDAQAGGGSAPRKVAKNEGARLTTESPTGPKDLKDWPHGRLLGLP